MSNNLHMQINGMPIPMNIDLERESEALKYTKNPQCGILQLFLLAPISQPYYILRYPCSKLTSL